MHRRTCVSASSHSHDERLLSVWSGLGTRGSCLEGDELSRVGERDSEREREGQDLSGPC